MTNPRTVPEVLRAAADLIAKPGAWIKDNFARTKTGRVVSVLSDEAVCWCVRGAVARCANVPVLALNPYEAYLQKAVGTNLLASWNDKPERKVGEVVAALRRAADLAEAAQ